MKRVYLSGQFCYKTDVGRVRLTNEDQANAVIDARGNILLVVCDGMGGQNKGDYASTIAINQVVDSFKSHSGIFLNKAHALQWLSRVIRSANAKVYEESTKNLIYNGMGTTITAVLLIKNYMVVAQIGDSRLYSLVDNKLKQITEDQTFVQYLYRTGKITKEEIATHPKRHVLMNALGIYPSLNLDIRIHPYHKERLLLCTDGLYNNVPLSDIESVIKGDDSPDQKVNELISIGNSNDGSDNIGLVIWEADE